MAAVFKKGISNKTKNNMVLIDALYINNSGGKVLLDYLINTILEKDLNNKFIFLLDKRGKYDYLENIDYEYGDSSEVFRYKFYKKSHQKYTKIFCFGNVPPPVNLKSEVLLYFHNVLLFESYKGDPLKVRLIEFFKKQYIKFFISNVDEIMVQTNYVKRMFNQHINKNKTVSLYPFFQLKKLKKNKSIDGYNFIYISNGNPHKNHMFLLNVWEELSKYNYFPTLNLTITDNYKTIIDRINKLNNGGLKIINHGFANVNKLLLDSNYLIYPSLKESFGLGLVESVNADLKVIGADLPYTNEVVEPSLVFNPYDKQELVKKLIRILSGDMKLSNSKIIVKNKINEFIFKLLS